MLADQVVAGYECLVDGDSNPGLMAQVLPQIMNTISGAYATGTANSLDIVLQDGSVVIVKITPGSPPQFTTHADATTLGS